MCLITFKRNAIFRQNRLNQKQKRKKNRNENETNQQGTEVK